MAERYRRLFTLPGTLYSPGSPLLIVAGALLQDTQSGRVIAQLKLKNLDSRPVKAVKVRITSQDTVGRTLGDVTEHVYLDLHAERDEEFGQKTPHVLPEVETRTYLPAVVEQNRMPNGRSSPKRRRFRRQCPTRNWSGNFNCSSANAAISCLRSWANYGVAPAVRSTTGTNPHATFVTARQVPCSMWTSQSWWRKRTPGFPGSRPSASSKRPPQRSRRSQGKGD